jgi:hypothetical protein
VNDSTEKLKADLVKLGDEFRARLGQVVPKRHAAYHGMWKAATHYFRALQKFEVGEYAEQELMDANKACEAALGDGLFIDEEDDERFHKFWDEANYLAEKGSERRQTPDGLRSLWISDGRAFGDLYRQLRKDFYNRLLG